MLSRMIPILCGVMLFSHVVDAREIWMTCDVIIDRTGESTWRNLLIDTDHRSVQDGDIAWRDGANSPISKDAMEFLKMDTGTAFWGYRDKATGAVGPTFTVNLDDGRYVMTGRDLNRLAHGVCRRAAVPAS